MGGGQMGERRGEALKDQTLCAIVSTVQRRAENMLRRPPAALDPRPTDSLAGHHG